MTFKEFYESHKGRYLTDVFYFKNEETEELYIMRSFNVGSIVLQKFGDYTKTVELDDHNVYHHYFIKEGNKHDIN